MKNFNVDGDEYRIDICDIQGTDASEEREGKFLIDGPLYGLQEYKFKITPTPEQQFNHQFLFGGTEYAGFLTSFYSMYPDAVVEKTARAFQEAIADYDKKIAAIDAGDWAVDVCDVKRVDENAYIAGDGKGDCDYHYEGVLVVSGPDGIFEDRFALQPFDENMDNLNMEITPVDFPDTFLEDVKKEVKSTVLAFAQKNKNTMLDIVHLDPEEQTHEIDADGYKNVALLSPFEKYQAREGAIDKLAVDYFMRDPDFAVQIVGKSGEPENGHIYMDTRGDLWLDDELPGVCTFPVVAEITPLYALTSFEAASYIWDSMDEEARFGQLVNWCHDYCPDKLGTFAAQDTVDAGKYGEDCFDVACGVLDGIKDKDSIIAVFAGAELPSYAEGLVEFCDKNEFLDKNVIKTPCVELPGITEYSTVRKNAEVYKPSENSPIYALAREKEISR